MACSREVRQNLIDEPPAIDTLTGSRSNKILCEQCRLFRELTSNHWKLRPGKRCTSDNDGVEPC